MSDIVISGYHGFKNSGDEALLWAILETLRRRKPDLQVTVLSKTPRETARVYHVRSVYRYNVFSVYREMKKAKLLLFGGGSLLQDATSSKSLLYYLGILSLARKSGIKTMLYANGIGPITKKMDSFLTARVLNRVDLITLRDDLSDQELRRLGVTEPPIKITADPAFTLDEHTAPSGRFFLNRAGIPEDAKVVVLSIRAWKKASPDFFRVLAELCDYMAGQHGLYPLFLPMQYPADSEAARAVMGNMKEHAYLIDRELTVPEVFSILSAAHIMIGMRLHSLIYATTLQIPALALIYDPKITAFMQSVNQPLCVNVEDFSLAECREKIDTLIRERDERSRLLRETNRTQKQKAEENGELAISLLD